MFILEVGIEELRHGLLIAGFAKGAVAGVIHCDGRVQRLWSHLVENREERLPWEASLIDIARNHHGSRDISLSVGDVYYFQPGHHCYIGRKLEITRSEDNGEPEARPASFVQGDDLYAPRPETLSECCDLADRIVLAMTPEDAEPERHKITVQRLKYQEHPADFDRLASAVENSLGRWGRFGFALDRCRGRAAGMLSVKGISDLVGALMLMPIVRHLAGSLNAIVARFDRKHKVNPGEWIIERPHYDNRFFSGLCGTRDSIRTEVYVDGAWLELPVGLDSIVVFPGKRARKRFGLRPTLHRVVHVGGDGEAERDPRTRNVTLLIGASTPD